MRFNRFLIAYLAVTVISIAGLWFAISLFEQHHDEANRRTFAIKAATFSMLIGTSEASLFSVKAPEKSDPGYERLKDRLRKLLAVNDDCRSTYVLTVRDNKLYFAADCDLESPSDDAKPGDLYDDAPEGLVAKLLENRHFAIGPYTDKWGTWISAFAPLPAPDGSKPVSYVGIDIEMSKWANELMLFRIFAICMAAVMVLAVIALLIVRRIVSNLVKEINFSKNYFRTVFNDTNEALIIFDPESHCIFEANRVFAEMLGFTQKEILDKRIDELIVPVNTETVQSDIDRFRTSNIVWATNQYLKKKDGTSAGVEVVGTRITFQGEECVIAVVRLTEEGQQ